MRIAMWSGPRNLSTAMMYSFGARSDCAVWDEPFYAAYLEMTGFDHPMRDEIIAGGEVDPAKVAARLCGSIPGDKPVFYQKHMTQHMIDGVDRAWMSEVTNVFLIRHPARVVASYAAKRENPTPDDIGFWQQAELFEVVKASGSSPVVIDSHDIRDDPEGMLRALCAAIGLPFEDAMLHWPAGGHKDDGVWSAHWYGAVHRSTGFAGVEGALPDVPDHLRPTVQGALPFYEEMSKWKLTS
ncbi:MAG: HAD family hydrolase [Sulfitobacter sp.]